MTEEPDNMLLDRTPHASPVLGSEADRAGSCLFLAKKPLSYEELLLRIQNKGLDFGTYTKESAIALFKRYGYYRLRGYWITFEKSGKFIPGTTLDAIMDVVELDEELSRFLLDALLTIELALRETLSYELSQAHGAYPLKQAEIFRNDAFFQELQNTLTRELSQGVSCKLPYVMHYVRKNQELPIWALVGLMSFGTISKVFRNLSDMKVARNVSKRFNLNAHTMASWLRYLTQLRNMCAHQDRLYNIMFAVRPALFREHKGLDTLRLFPAFIVVFHMLESIDARYAASMRVRFGNIMNAHAQVDLRPIGFPTDWHRYIPDTRGPVLKKDRNGVRQRSSNAGRKRKNQAALEEALYLYDTNACTIAQIAERTGVGHSTLYKYINLRKQGVYPHCDYAVMALTSVE